MEKKEFPLDKREEIYKRDYQEWSRPYLQRPITFSEWETLDIEKRRPYLLTRKFHEKVTTNTPGNTVVDVGVEGDWVQVVRHPRYSLPILHNHAYVELAYIYRGQCTHFINQQTLQMREGDLCILAPEAMHAISVQDDDTILIDIMMSKSMFDSSFLRMLQGGKALSGFMERVLYQQRVSPYVLYPTGADPYLHMMILKTLEEKEQRDYLFNESVILYVKHIFIHLIRNYEMNALLADPEDNSQNGSILAVIRYLSTHYKDVTLKQMADFFGYNENHMSKLIHRYTGQTFSTLVTSIQMENAAKLLAETKLSITEISNEVGCYDSSHLTRKFRSQYGVSPNQYRKQNRKEEP